MKQPKLRDSRNLITELYPINKVPRDVINKLGADIVYMMYTGRRDLTGNDWGDIFAKAVEGTHLSRPIGIVDVAKDKVTTQHPYRKLLVNKP